MIYPLGGLRALLGHKPAQYRPTPAERWPRVSYRGWLSCSTADAMAARLRRAHQPCVTAYRVDQIQRYIYNFIRHIGSTKIINKKEIINNQTYIQWTIIQC